MAAKRITPAQAKAQPQTVSEETYRLALSVQDGIEVAKVMIVMALLGGSGEDDGMAALNDDERDTYLHHIDEVLAEARKGAGLLSAAVHGAWIAGEAAK